MSRERPTQAQPGAEILSFPSKADGGSPEGRKAPDPMPMPHDQDHDAAWISRAIAALSVLIVVAPAAIVLLLLA